MKNILLLVHDDEGQEARLQAALDITRAVGGHLSCLEVVVPPIALTYDPYMGTAAGEFMTIECEREDKNRARLEARLAHEDVSWDWSETLGFPEDVVINASSLADLIILTSHLERKGTPEVTRIAINVVNRAKRPVLAVPQDLRSIDPKGTAVVAWDGSREAGEALRDAVPLLRLAEQVILIGVDAPQGAFTAVSAASYLSQHGIHAEIKAISCQAGHPVFRTILDEAHAVDAAYIVMGAYSHSRATEAIFGGVTRSMMANSDLPLFLSH